MRHSLRLPRRPSAASEGEASVAVRSPEPARLDSEEEAAALAQRDPAEVEEAGSLAAASGQNGGGEPDQPWWAKYGETEEQAAKRVAGLDHLRGHQAREIGSLRRQLRLAARLYDDATAEPDAMKALAADTALRAILDPQAPRLFVETFERMIAPDQEAL